MPLSQAIRAELGRSPNREQAAVVMAALTEAEADAFVPEDVDEARGACQHIAFAEVNEELGDEGKQLMGGLRVKSVGRVRRAVRRMREVLSHSPSRRVAPEK